MKRCILLAVVVVSMCGCNHNCRIGQRFRQHQAPVAMQCVPVQCAPVVAPATQACPEPQLSPTFP